jgi:hypothetical protein
MAAVTIFERLSQGRPAETTMEQPPKEPAQKLLDWLQTWNKPTICAREILMYGPRSTRKQKDADDATKVLQKYGWLVPLETNQRDWRRWQIIRQPTLHPTIAR